MAGALRNLGTCVYLEQITSGRSMTNSTVLQVALNMIQMTLKHAWTFVLNFQFITAHTSNMCYRLIDGTTPNNAANRCNSIGYQLPSNMNQEEYDNMIAYITNVTNNPDSWSVYVGLRERGESWYWELGTTIEIDPGFIDEKEPPPSNGISTCAVYDTVNHVMFETDSGTWTPCSESNAVVCVTNYDGLCRSKYVITNGNSTYYPGNNTLYQSCYEGYAEMPGGDTSWEHSCDCDLANNPVTTFINCQAPPCGPPPDDMLYASVSYSTLTVGSIATYTCLNPEFKTDPELNSSTATSTCTILQTWTPPTGTCQAFCGLKLLSRADGYYCINLNFGYSTAGSGDVIKVMVLDPQCNKIDDRTNDLAGALAAAPGGSVIVGVISGEYLDVEDDVDGLNETLNALGIVHNETTSSVFIAYKDRLKEPIFFESATEAKLIRNVSLVPDCGLLPDRDDTISPVAYTTYATSVANYTCQTGTFYAYNDFTRTVTCEWSGQWSAVQKPSVCQPVSCGDPVAAPNATVMITTTTLSNGGKSKHKCIDGHEFPDGTTKQYSNCSISAQWEPVAACELIDCGPPSNVSNSSLSFNSTEFGSTAVYTCQGLMVFNDTEESSAISTCGENAKWSNVGECTFIDCGTPSNVSNSSLSFNSTEFGSTAVYTCQGLMVFNDTEESSAISTCGENAKWSNVGECTFINCGPPFNVSNSSLLFNSTEFGSTAVYTCQGLMVFNDTEESSAISTCGENAKWSNVGECTFIDCGPPSNVSNSSLSFNSTEFGSTAVYTCQGIMVFNDTEETSAISTCGGNAKWSNVGECTYAGCGLPDHLNHGSYTIDGTVQNSKANYTCDQGYIFDNGSGYNTTAICASNGWATLSAECIVIDCGPPSNVSNSTLSLNSTEFGSTVVYTCQGFMGFMVFNDTEESSAISTCGENGKWSNVGECTYAGCGLPDHLNHGSYTIDGTVQNSKAIYTCDQGYVFDRGGGHNKTVNCAANGWTTLSAECIEITTESLQSNTTMLLETASQTTQSLSSDTTRAWETTSQYVFLTKTIPVTMTTDIEKVTQEDTGYIIPVTCPTLPELQNTELWYPPNEDPNLYYLSNHNSVDSIAVYKCKHGYRFPEGGTEHSVVCTNSGVWRIVPDPCSGIRCLELPIIQNSIKTIEGSRVTYNCLEGTLMAHGTPSVTIECSSNGKWNDYPTDCLGTRCGAFPQVQNAKVVSYNADDYTPHVILQCDKSHLFTDGSNSKTLHCLQSLKWEYTDQCYVQVCEQLDPPLNGYLSSPAARVDKSVHAYCDTGYWFSPYNFTYTLDCTTQIQWSGLVVNCTGVYCSNPAQVLGATMTLTGTSYQSVTTYACDNPSQKLDDGRSSVQVECQANGLWEHEGLYASCSNGRCDRLPSITNGHPDTTVATEGSIVMILCDKGYEFLTGLQNQTVYCNGVSWNITETKCHPISCPTLSTLKHGTAHTTDTLLGSQAQITCNTGYHIMNKSIGAVTCGPDKTWEGMFNDCQPIGCGPTPSITNGNKDKNEGYYLDKVKYVCNEGYRFRKGVFDKELACGAGGEWEWDTHENITCEEVFCSSPPYWTGAMVQGVKKSTFSARQRINMTCSEGTKLPNGDPYIQSVCQKSGEWGPPLPECIFSGQIAIKATNDAPATESQNSQRIGIILISLLAVVIGFLILIDIPALISDIKRGVSNIASGIGYKTLHPQSGSTSNGQNNVTKSNETTSKDTLNSTQQSKRDAGTKERTIPSISISSYDTIQPVGVNSMQPSISYDPNAPGGDILQKPILKGNAQKPLTKSQSRVSFADDVVGNH